MMGTGKPAGIKIRQGTLNQVRCLVPGFIALVLFASGMASASNEQYPTYYRKPNAGDAYNWTFSEAEAAGVAYYNETFNPAQYGYTFPHEAGIESSVEIFSGSEVTGYRNTYRWDTHDPYGNVVGGMKIVETLCMPGYVYAILDNDPSTRSCYSTGLPIIDTLKNYGVPESCPVGNPVNVGTGNKFLTETDFQSAGPDHLEFVRTYNSTYDFTVSRVGKFWVHHYERGIYYSGTGMLATARVLRGDGRVYTFQSTDNVTWTPGEEDIHATLERLFDAGGTMPIG